MNKFNSKESLLDFLKSSWENGKIMDANNFSKTWEALVKNLKFEDGYRPEVTIVDGTDGTHTLTISKPDGTTNSTVIKDGKNGVDGKDGFSPEVTLTNGNDGTHTLTISKPDGTTTSTIIKDGKNGANGENGADGKQGTPGKDGFSPEVTIVDGTDGTHTLTISKPDGTTNSTVIKDGKNGVDGKDGFSPEVTLTNEKDGTHTLTITKPGGVTTSAVIKDGKNGANGAPGTPGKDGFSPEVTLTNGNDGTHTLTISKPDGTTTSTIIKDGKNGANGENGADGKQGTPGKDGFSPKVTLTNGNDGTHTLTISKPDGTTTSAVIKDGKNGADGKQGAPGKDGFSPEVTIVDGTDGTHTLTISKPGGTITSTIIKDGKNGVDGKDGANGENGADGAPGTPGKDGFSPEVTITDGTDGSHTLTITKPDGGAASTIIHDGKNGKDGKDGTPGVSYTHPLDKNSMSVMSYSHTYYPLYQTENFDSSSPFYKFTPDIKVEVNSVAVDAPKGSIATELSDAGWTKGLTPTSYVITMLSNHIPNLIPLAGGNFIFNGGAKGDLVEPTTLDVPIDSLKLPTADGTSKSIADIGFISSAPSFDMSPMFFMSYPRPFLIPVRVVEKTSGNQPEIIETNTAIVSIAPDEFSLRNVPVLSREVNRELIYAKFSPSRKSISELPNVFKYSWTAGTVHIPFNVDLLQWNKTKANFDRHYRIQSDSCKNVEVYPIFDPVSGMPSPSDNEFVKSIVLNSAGREVMKILIGDPNNLGLINL